MSKGNMFLGFARGKVGDVVFTRVDGEQVTRVRNRSPKNPKTPRQGVQRSILKTVSQAYSALNLICDHSFEGYATGTPNQSRFAKLNIDMLRSQVLANVNLSDDQDILDATITNYSPALISNPVLNAYKVSEGSLPQMGVRWSTNLMQLSVNGVNLGASFTYQDLVSALNAERGDQLTFMFVYGDDVLAQDAGTITGFEVSRVILEPANGVMTTAFLAGNAVNSPNESNSGRIWFDQGEVGYLDFGPTSTGGGTTGGARIVMACAVILSRRYAGNWRRSTQNLVLRSNATNDLQSWPLGDAANSFLAPEAGSSLYLNQAENF